MAGSRDRASRSVHGLARSDVRPTGRLRDRGRPHAGRRSRPDHRGLGGVGCLRARVRRQALAGSEARSIPEAALVSGRSASDPDVARPPLRASRASRPGIARRACHQRFLPRARARAAAAPIATRYLGAASTAAAIAAAELAYLFERDRDEPVFENFGDAVIWGFSTVLALQADPVPESAAARVVMLVAFLFGLVIVASLAGTVGAFLVDHWQGERRSSASE